MSSVSIEDCARLIINAFSISERHTGSRADAREWIRNSAFSERFGTEFVVARRVVITTRDFQVAKLLVRHLSRAGLNVRAELKPNGVSRVHTYTPGSSIPKGAPEGTISKADYGLWTATLSSIVAGSVWASDLGGELFSLSAAFSRLQKSDLPNGEAISRKIRSLAKELKAVNGSS